MHIQTRKSRKTRLLAAVAALWLLLCACGAKNSGGSNGAGSGAPALDGAGLFTERDLDQSPDTADAERYTLQSGQTLTITAGGVYVLSGSAGEGRVVVDAPGEKVRLVLDGLHLTSSGLPCIDGQNADKLFLTTAEGSENSLRVTGAFRSGEDAAVFSRGDLVLNGCGSLEIVSPGKGVECKDDLSVTGGSLTVRAAACALRANDSVRISGGALSLEAGSDGIHAEQKQDETTGFVYVGGGSITLRAGDDGIHAETIVQIDGGSLAIRADEGIEGTWVQLNDGSVEIAASSDGINGAAKSSACRPTVEINGGALRIVMGQGDTDAIDSNGDLFLNGGSVDITAEHPFDFDGEARFNGGSLIVNGEALTDIPKS